MCPASDTQVQHTQAPLAQQLGPASPEESSSEDKSDSNPETPPSSTARDAADSSGTESLAPPEPDIQPMSSASIGQMHSSPQHCSADSRQGSRSSDDSRGDGNDLDGAELGQLEGPEACHSEGEESVNVSDDQFVELQGADVPAGLPRALSGADICTRITFSMMADHEGPPLLSRTRGLQRRRSI